MVKYIIKRKQKENGVAVISEQCKVKNQTQIRTEYWLYQL